MGTAFKADFEEISFLYRANLNRGIFVDTSACLLASQQVTEVAVIVTAITDALIELTHLFLEVP